MPPSFSSPLSSYSSASYASPSAIQQLSCDLPAVAAGDSACQYIRLVSSSDTEYHVPLDRLIQASGFFRRLYTATLSMSTPSKFVEMRESTFKFPFIHSECLESICQYIMRPMHSPSEPYAAPHFFSIRPDLAMDLLLISDVLDL